MATDNIGVELLAATPFRHKVGTGQLGLSPLSISAAHPDGAQWYLAMRKAACPYVGAGINYTTFFNEDFNDTGKAAGFSDLSLKDSWRGGAGRPRLSD